MEEPRFRKVDARRWIEGRRDGLRLVPHDIRRRVSFLGTVRGESEGAPGGGSGSFSSRARRPRRGPRRHLPPRILCSAFWSGIWILPRHRARGHPLASSRHVGSENEVGADCLCSRASIYQCAPAAGVAFRPSRRPSVRSSGVGGCRRGGQDTAPCVCSHS